MLISWNWLKQYVELDMPPEEFERRLMMAGLNHESTTAVGEDLAIDLEVTSNRPDCLGHLGIARETAVLWNRPLRIPPARPPEGPTPANQLVRVRIDCLDLCSRYTARVVRGVRVGPSPAWLVKRLETLGIAAINNVVDVSNYVLMECGQPLHAFDYGKLRGGKVPEIIVRQPLPGEQIEAINHKAYPLEAGMCLICDAQSPVAIGGIMGGASTEVSTATQDVLVEAAEFDPIGIRWTARRLGLHSDSSYRFERRIDSEGIDWASRRCCELILETAGGELAAGVVDVGSPRPARQPITLRLEQLKRILGIDVPAARVREILLALGCEEAASGATTTALCLTAPSWRRDLSREIDLVEEVARIHGYEQIPEDVGVPMAPSARRREDRVVEKVRHVLTACGFDEALTLSVVDEAASERFSPWTTDLPLVSQMPVIRGADRLRTSLVPSLLAARQTNESLSNPDIELFETAKIYLPRGEGLPDEPWMLGLASGRDFATVKGVVEAIVAALDPAAQLEAERVEISPLDPEASCRLRLGQETLAYVGQLTAEGRKQFDLRGPATVAELRLGVLVARAQLVPQYVPLPLYPAVSRDLNLVVDESVRWAEVATTVRGHGGPMLEEIGTATPIATPSGLGRVRKACCFRLPYDRRPLRLPVSRRMMFAIRWWRLVARPTGLNSALRSHFKTWKALRKTNTDIPF